MKDLTIAGKKYAGILDVHSAHTLYPGAGSTVGAFILMGRLTHDELGRFPDNSPIQTSPVVGITLRETDLVALTQNSAYRLRGDVFEVIDSNEEFRRMFDLFQQTIKEIANR